MEKEHKAILEQLGKGMMIVLIANIIKMVFSVLLNFIEPKFLSVDTYAAVKTFTLYISATGIFHLGYEDGSYLKFGGKTKESIDKEEISDNISTLRIFQLLVMLVIFFVGFVIKDDILMIFAILLLPYNMTMHFKLFYQAVGDFKLYGRIMNCSTGILFLGEVALIFLFKYEKYYWYLALQVLIYTIIWIILETNLMETMGLKLRILQFSVKELATNIKSGFLIMVGNFSSIFLTSMDRWFVKILLSSMDFAAYSFAVSMEGFLTVAISPFTVTLYNYFCREKRVEHIRKIHNYILLFATVLVAAAFPLKFILETWLTAYIESTSVLFYLFASQILFIVIKSIYVNLYKAQQQQRKYFVKLMVVLASGAVFNAVCYYFLRIKEAMALGTLFSALLWFVLCQLDFREIIYDWKHYTYMAVSLISFLIVGNTMGALSGLLIYLAIILLSAVVFIREDLINTRKVVKNILTVRK